VAVWGPTGAPGRTTVAVGLADEAARLGVSTLLVDADVYGGVVAQVLGLLDESPGLAGAARLAGAGGLDLAALVRLAWAVRPQLRVLTGLARADRWPELRPGAVGAVLEEARRMAELIVVDCSFNLEDDEELSFDTAAPRRNGATLAVLDAADTVLCVSGADPVALQRSVRALDELRDVLPDAEPVLVVNQLRRGPVPGEPRTEIAAAVARFTGREVGFFLPLDRDAADAALASGRTLAEVAPRSPLRTALRSLAASVAGVAAPSRARRGLWRDGRAAG
jgi:Flp pilus assembly CpaE family ATPase